MTGAPPADAAARHTALDAQQSFIVQAPAGSGKTGLLIQRVLVLLAQVADPEEIVAITFTRKAAGEIRHRVTEALERGASAEPPAEPHAKLTWELARRALANAQARGWDLGTQRLQARTIDAFCEWIARRAPLVSGHGDRRQTIDDARGLYREAIRRILRSGAPSVSYLLWHLDNDVPQFHKLFETLLAHRDQWSRHLRGSGTELRAALEATLRAVGDAHVVALAAAAPTCFVHAAPGLLQFAAAQLREDAPPRPAAVSSADLAWWQRCAALVLTAKGTVRARVTKAQGFPAAKDAEDPALAKERKKEMVELLGELAGAGHKKFITLLAEVPGLPPPRFADEQWQIVQQLQELLEMLVTELQVVFGEEQQVDHTEVASAAIRTLEQRAGSSDTFGITHLLVDEFQDTSVAQYRLLKLLTQGWTSGAAHTLFLVGDPMQSIYRFREANVELFLHCQEHGLGDCAVTPLTLTENFRSAPALVEIVNEVFAEAFDPDFDGQPGAVPYTPFTPHAGAAGGSIDVHAWSGDHRRLEAESVAQLVEQAQRDGHSSIAILVRSRHHLDVVLPVLRRRGILYRAVDFEALAARTVVRDLQALTGAILSPCDRVAWLALLRGPWCGLTLAQLAHLADGATAIFPEQLRDLAGALDAGANARLDRLVTIVEAAFVQRGRSSLRDRVTSAWVALGAPALLSPAELDEAEQFFDVLDEIAVEGDLPRPEDLTARLSDLFARPDPLPVSAVGEAEPAVPVDVMTIHRSKGLEFDCVILPGLGRAPRPTENRLLLWDEDADGALLLGAMHSRRGPSSQGEEDPIYRYLRRVHRAKDQHELRRLLYVASTRARRQLHLLGHLAPREGEDPRPHHGSALSVLGEGLLARFRGAVDPDIPPPEEEHPPPPIARRLAAGWQGPPPVEGVVASSVTPSPLARPTDGGSPQPWQSGRATASSHPADAAAFGTVMHRLLATVSEAADPAQAAAQVATPAAIRTALLMEGCYRDHVDAEAEDLIVTLGKVLDDPRAAWILRRRESARNEFEVAAVVAGVVRRVRVDRTWVEDGTRWVIDYKTTRAENAAGLADPAHSGPGVSESVSTAAAGAESPKGLSSEQIERHREQLTLYREVLSCADPRHPIRLALYFPRSLGWWEMPS